MAIYTVMRRNPKDLDGKFIRVCLFGYGNFMPTRDLAEEAAARFNDLHRIEMEGRKELEAFVLVIPGK